MADIPFHWPPEAKAEIERLQNANQDLVDERDIFKRTLDKRDAEIERLRGELGDVTSKPFAYCTEPRSEILARQQAEIERLRGILEDACRWHEQFPVQRVREALGE